MIVTFTDFGAQGPYLGQVKAVFHTLAPGVPVVDLLADAPAFDPRSSAYLLAALAGEFPPSSVFFAVVDPGVGGDRVPMVAKIDGRLFVGPDNGLFEPLARRGASVEAWEIRWRPDRLSASFHGRDLFAPVAARLAAGSDPEAAGCAPMAFPGRPDWTDDLPAIVYVDGYGNAMTGLRAASVPADSIFRVGGRALRRARTFGDVPMGEAMWYENANGLVEFSVNGGRADRVLGIGVGATVRYSL